MGVMLCDVHIKTTGSLFIQERKSFHQIHKCKLINQWNDRYGISPDIYCRYRDVEIGSKSVDGRSVVDRGSLMTLVLLSLSIAHMGAEFCPGWRG